jgi:hypothetical protein
MHFIKTASPIVYRYLSDSKFKKEFDQESKVNRSYDIPYVAGYSMNDRVIFIDRHFKKMMGSIDIEPYIFIHEKCEKALLDVFKLKYQQAHHIATHFERMVVAKDGIDWNKYEHFVSQQYKHIGHEKLKKIPPNLDITPYKDEKDFYILKQLKK